MTHNKTPVVAIHQPNFFPWLGYFNKIASSDFFVFLDDVQFPKKGGSWSNRVQLMIGGESRWFTAAIDRQFHGTRLINEMNFLENKPWRQKLVKMLDNEYRRHPFFAEVSSIVNPLLLNSESNIAEYNIQAVSAITEVLGLDTSKLRRSSSSSVTGSSNDLLCKLTRSVGGNTYLCGGGASGYQDDAFFSAQGVGLQYQNFQHPIYQQKGQTSFVPGLSIIDVAMNIGWQETRKILLSSLNPSAHV